LSQLTLTQAINVTAQFHISIALGSLVSREQDRLQCAPKDTGAYSSTGSEF